MNENVNSSRVHQMQQEAPPVSLNTEGAFANKNLCIDAMSLQRFCDFATISEQQGIGPLYASFSIAASGVRYSLQHSSYMREYSLLGLWCIRLLRVWES